ncbi:hypothetical protein BDFB_009575 [Asbolus verrucosus]|uniref:Uncharacterized protein n=1 Tax=Asbolus verrucosus TaxID=1661398 RepID=A0A482WA94_ASBVE|nr:hypothetical protein BDFB_009575 [Asbolus verrucosus]
MDRTQWSCSMVRTITRPQSMQFFFMEPHEGLDIRYSSGHY